MRMLDDARAFVEAFCARHGIAERDVARLALVVEELFTNSVKHGYGRECDELIEIALAAEPACINVHYQDAAGPYDPLQALSAARLRLFAPAEQRPIGGLGLQLVTGLTDAARYSREAGHNRLQLRVDRQR